MAEDIHAGRIDRPVPRPSALPQLQARGLLANHGTYDMNDCEGGWV